ncbi:MAG: MFS transporter [Chloroflexi bacterium]|nr:MFS transporter [Chloroflexota bacterium]MXY00204.1 MFS transporter [Chloroflexota bacterium]MYB17132.1 MFS transporter [Chloroflexota bacterium]
MPDRVSEPLAPARRGGIFWGWWIVIGAIVGQFAAMGSGGAIAGVFLRPMTSDLGWAAAEYTLGGSTAFLVGGIAGFIVGPLVDRFGARPLMLIGACIYAMSFFLMSQISALWQFVALSMLAGGAGFAMIGTLVVNSTLAKWFVVRRGWAIALGSSGISLAGLIMPVSMTGIVDWVGWRDAYVVLAAVMFAIIVPAALVMRRRPEDYGLLPDGADPRAWARAGAELAAAQARDAENSLSRGQALRTSAIWLLIVGYGCNTLALTAVLVHAIPFLTDHGFARTEAALAIAVNGGANLSSKFVWGFLLQRIHVRKLSATALCTSATGVALMLLSAQAGSLGLMFVAFSFWGFGFGGSVPLSEFIWAKYFGRVHIGAVRGVGAPFTVALGAVGPVLAGLYFDAIGSYTGAFVAFAGVYLVGATAIFVSREPQPRPGPAAESGD